MLIKVLWAFIASINDQNQNGASPNLTDSSDDEENHAYITIRKDVFHVHDLIKWHI